MNIQTYLKSDMEYFKQWDWRKSVAVAFFATQLILIVWARFAPERWFCWAPHDTQTEYELTVFVNGRELGDREIYDRYHRDKKYRDVRAPGNVKGMIIQQSLTYGKNDETLVTMKYAVNGIPQEPWVWHHTPEKK